MKAKTTELKEKDLQKAHDAGCSDVKRTLELLHPDFFKKEETYKVGDKITISHPINEAFDYIIADAGKYKVLLVCFEDGDRFDNVFTVANQFKITDKELKKVIDGKYTYKKLKT